MTRFYTYRDDVPLAPGQALAFTAGKGYYAKAGPAPKPEPVGTSPDNRGGARGPAPGPAQEPVLQTSPNDPTTISGEVPVAVVEAGGGGGGGSSGGDGGGSGGSGSGSSGSGSGGTGSGKLAADVDWSAAFFGSLGLPADVQARINQIFSQYSDTGSATAAATAYIRGTPWYDVTFPGIKDAFAKGIVSSETDYRNLLNQQTQVYKRYLGRDITSDEFVANLGEGANLGTVEGRLKGAAYVGAYGGDIKYALGNFDTGVPNAPDLQALGETNVGLDNPIGMKLQRALDVATKRMQGVFGNGQLGSPGLSFSNGRLVSQRGTAKPDVAA